MLSKSSPLRASARAGLWLCVAWLWAGGAAAATAPDRRLLAATPHTPPASRYKYIPLSSNSAYGNSKPLSVGSYDSVAEPSRPGLAPSELILTVLRTALDVVRGVNAKRQAVRNDTRPALTVSPRSKGAEEGRGFEDYYDEHDHYTTTTTTTPKPAKPRYTDPWAGYYDFIINEGSFKFWSVFQLFTAALLLYACLSAIYYAKFNPIIPDYDREYDDYFLERTVGRQARSLDPSQLVSGLTWMNPRTFQFILDAISKNYET